MEHNIEEVVEEVIIIKGPDDRVQDVIEIEAEIIDSKAKTVTIVVDGTPHEWPKGTKITFSQVVTLEFPEFVQHPEITYSVTYEFGNGDKHEHILVPGASVEVKEGMIFCVSETGQS